MRDIVERLRAVDNDWETAPCYNGLRIEAADEIERLRDWQRELAGWVIDYMEHGDRGALTALRALIEEAGHE